jgi:UDPglucose 6-dehydrogenase
MDVLERCDLVFVSLDVATDGANRSQLQDLRQLLGLVFRHARPGAVVVVLCQVPPGFTRELVEIGARADKDLKLYYQVETLIFGRAVERAMNPERLIVGCSDPDQPLPQQYSTYLSAFACPVLSMRYESAELTKLSINTYLAAAVSVTNSLAELCGVTGADWYEIIPALKLDRRIGEYAYLNPGLGIGGGNLERDLVTLQQLAEDNGADPGIVVACQENSRYNRDWVLRRIRDEVCPPVESRIAVWGLAYKPDTHSIKNSPAVYLMENLLDFKLQVYDPKVRLELMSEHVNQVSSALGACQGAEALVVMTPWSEFTSIDLGEVGRLMANKIVVDPYRSLNGAMYIENGFDYTTLGV